MRYEQERRVVGRGSRARAPRGSAGVNASSDAVRPRVDWNHLAGDPPRLLGGVPAGSRPCAAPDARLPDRVAGLERHLPGELFQPLLGPARQPCSGRSRARAAESTRGRLPCGRMAMGRRPLDRVFVGERGHLGDDAGPSYGNVTAGAIAGRDGRAPEEVRTDARSDGARQTSLDNRVHTSDLTARGMCSGPLDEAARRDGLER